MTTTSWYHGSACLAFFFVCAPLSAVIPVREPEASKVVDFSTDVFPFLSDNCVSCHSKTTRKGGLNLESPADILKGGDSGAAAAPGQGAESLLVKAAIHEDAESAMPPRDNKVKARNLSPEQIGLLKRWIDQGAKAGSSQSRELKWQQLPPHLRSIYAVSASADGRFAACSRGNQIYIYEVSTGREVFHATAHSDEVQSLCFSPDARLLFSGGFRELKVWKRTGEVVSKALNFGAGISAVSEDGRLVAAASGNAVSVREVDQLEKVAHAFETSAPVALLEWSPDAGAVAILNEGGSVQVWSRGDGRLVSMENSGNPKSILWRRDGKALFVCAGDAVLREWEFGSGQSVRERGGHSSQVVAVAAAGSVTVVGCADATVALWDAGATAPMKHFKTPAKVVALAVAVEGKKIAVAGDDAVLRVFDFEGKMLFEVKGDPAAQATAEEGLRRAQIEEANLAFRKETLAEAEKAASTAKDRAKKSADALKTKSDDVVAKEKAVAAFPAQVDAARKTFSDAESALKAGAESVAKLETDSGEAKSALEKLNADPAAANEAKAEANQKLAEMTKALEAARTAQKAREAALKAGQDALDSILKKETAARDEAQKAQVAKKVAETESQLSAAEEKSSAESVVQAKAAFATQEVARKKAGDDSAALTKAAEGNPPISCMSVEESAGVILIGHASGLVQVRSLSGGGVVTHFRDLVDAAVPRPVCAVRWREVSVFASAEGGRAVRFDASQKWSLAKTIGDGKNTAPFRDRVLSLAFSPDGKRVAVGGGDPSREGDVLVWNVDALDEAPKKFSGIHSDTVLGLAFSPDGKSLVSGGADKVARVLDLQEMRVVRALEGHTHHVLGVSWSPDGRSILTAGADNTIKIWDASNGTRKKSVDGADKEVTAVQFLGAGSQFIASSGDGKVRVIALNGTVAKTITETAFVNAINATLHGKMVFGGGDDGILRLWNPNDGTKIGEFK